MILLDPFETAKPELVPLEVLPAAPAVTLASTAHVADPGSADTLQIGETFQGHVLALGDVVLLMGQNDPAQNGFYTPLEVGADLVLEPYFAELIEGPAARYNKQFKVAVTAGTNAGKTYFLANQVPALFSEGIKFYELTASTPRVRTSNYDLTPPEVIRVADPPFDATYVCKVAVNGNTALPLNPGDITLDGEDLVAGDYFLLKGQTEPSENGVLQVSADEAPAKAQATGLVRARITAGTNAGKQFSVDQDTGVVTNLAPGVID